VIIVRPRLAKYFDLIGISIDGKLYRPTFTVDYVAQSSSWLVNMSVKIDEVVWSAPEYQNTPEINHRNIAQMCNSLELYLNLPKGNAQAYYDEINKEKSNTVKNYYQSKN